MRTAASQISATLALLVKALHPGVLDAGTPLQVQQTRAPQSGVRVEETSSARKRFAMETPPRVPADFEEKKGAGKPAGMQSNFKFHRRRCECIATFSKYLAAAQTVFARKFAVQLSSPPESEERMVKTQFLWDNGGVESFCVCICSCFFSWHRRRRATCCVGLNLQIKI